MRAEMPCGKPQKSDMQLYCLNNKLIWLVSHLRIILILFSILQISKKEKRYPFVNGQADKLYEFLKS